MKRLALLLACPLAAHELFLVPSSMVVSPNEAITVSMVNGDSFPASDNPPSLQRLRDAILVSASGVYNLTNLREVDKAVIADARIHGKGTLLVAVRTVPNFLAMKPDEFTKYLKEDGLEHVLAWRERHAEAGQPSRELYSKYAKSLLVSGGAPSDFHRHVVGHTIEIVPEQNPHALRSGDPLIVHVLLRGKPAAGLLLRALRSAAGKTEVREAGRTDAEGRVRVQVSGPATWGLHVIAMERRADPKAADWESFWASLTFELP